MARIPLLSLLFSAFVALAPLAGGQEVGTPLPPIELQGLTQTDAKRFSDFYGRAVLLEFFAHWCAPCAKSVPHLNEWQKKYGEQGLSIVGVTSDGPTKTEPWVKKHRLEYAYGYDLKAELEKLFGIGAQQGIPYAVLVDPFGTIVWRGHPSALTDERIERALHGALELPVWKWPAAARDLAGQLARGEFAAALNAASALSAQAQEGAANPVALVRERIDAHLAHFERLVARSDYRTAFELAERLKEQLATLPEADELAARVAELQADPQVKHVLAGQARLEELEQAASAAQDAEQLTALRPALEALVKDYPGTRIERRAQVLLAEIERALTPKGPKGNRK